MKTIKLLSVVVSLFALAACGGDSSTESQSDPEAEMSSDSETGMPSELVPGVSSESGTVGESSESGTVGESSDSKTAAPVSPSAVEGIWFAYTDVGDDGASTIGNSSDEYGYIVIFDDDGIYAGVNEISLNKGGNMYDPYIAIGFEPDRSMGCAAFSYEYKGASHNFVTKLSTVTDNADYSMAVSKSSGWTQVVAKASKLAQPDWGDPVVFDVARINQFHWQVKTTADDSKLYVRNFKCSNESSEQGGGSSSSGGTVISPNKKDCAETMTDARDGRTYCIATIGDQVWMAEDLKYDWEYIKEGLYYSWEEAKLACPTGWRLPSSSEMKILADTLNKINDKFIYIQDEYEWRDSANSLGFNPNFWGYYHTYGWNATTEEALVETVGPGGYYFGGDEGGSIIAFEDNGEPVYSGIWILAFGFAGKRYDGDKFVRVYAVDKYENALLPVRCIKD